MSEKNLEIYEQVADMIMEVDPIGGPKTPAFIRLLSLQLTEAEARLALKITTTGGTLDEIAERSGMKKEKLLIHPDDFHGHIALHSDGALRFSVILILKDHILLGQKRFDSLLLRPGLHGASVHDDIHRYRPLNVDVHARSDPSP